MIYPSMPHWIYLTFLPNWKWCRLLRVWFVRKKRLRLIPIFDDYVFLTIVDGIVGASMPSGLHDLPCQHNDPTDYIRLHTVEHVKELVEERKLHYFMRSMVFNDRIASIKDPALRTLMHRIVLVDNMYAYAFTNILFDEDTTDAYMKDWLNHNR